MATRKKPKRTGAVRVVHKHLYAGDGVLDHRGHDRCGDCGLDADHSVHQLDPVDPDVAEASQRITGERGD